MAQNFQSYSSEILAHVSEVGIQLSKRFINRALRDIYESRLWSFLTFEGVFVAPPIITSGKVTSTQYSNTITLDATATTALSGLANPLITSRQIRVGPLNGGVYNIAAFDPIGQTITLDRLYMEKSATGASYQVYRCYYQPCDANGSLITDWLTFISMVNPDLGYRISRSHLRYQKVEIDNMDPLRADQGLSYYVATYKYDNVNQTPIYELWPHPTYSSGYVYLGRRRGVQLVNPNDQIPGILSSDMLVERALYYVSEWAEKNKGRYPQLRASDWRFMQTQHDKSYRDMLRDAQRQDDEIFLETYIPSQWSDDLFLDESMQVSTLLSTQSTNNWKGG